MYLRLPSALLQADTAEPTEASVIAVLEAGASHVLRLPAEPSDLLRVLGRSRPR